jgi:hypothetical protein
MAIEATNVDGSSSLNLEKLVSEVLLQDTLQIQDFDVMKIF